MTRENKEEDELLRVEGNAVFFARLFFDFNGKHLSELMSLCVEVLCDPKQIPRCRLSMCVSVCV